MSVNRMPVIDSFGCKVCSLIHVLMLGAAEDLTCLLCKNIHALPRRVKLADPDFPEDVKKSSLESFSKTTQTSEASDSEWNGLNERAKRPKRPRPNKEKTKAKKTQDLATQEPNIKKKKKYQTSARRRIRTKTQKKGKS